MKLAFVAPLLLALLAGCDRRLEPWIPPEQEPPPSERPVRVPGLETPMARPQALMAASPAGQRGMLAAGPSVRGQITLADGVSPPRSGVLFLIARHPGVGGPPLAVKRLPSGPYPLAFEIGPADVMIAGQPFAGEIELTARIDSDGNPMTHDPADLTASLSGPVQPPSEAVELQLGLAAN